MKSQRRTRIESSRQRREASARYAAELLLRTPFIEPTEDNTAFRPFMVLLCGLPGSGKSTFARTLVQAMPYKFARISQDELGNRRACEAMCRDVMEQGRCPVIDRCNFDYNQRRNWINLAGAGTSRDASSSSSRRDVTASSRVCLVTFDTPVKECVFRCRNRENHQTVSPDEADRIVKMIDRQMSMPDQRERRSYNTIVRVSNETSFHEAVQMLWNKLQ